MARVRYHLTEANQVYAQVIQKTIGSLPQGVTMHSMLVPTGENLHVQCTAMIPKNAKRFVLVDAGLGHTFAEDVYWLAEMAKQGSAVVLTEAYSHGPFSSGFPIFGNNEDMTKAMMKVREGGLIHFFEQHPELAALPVFAELGQSWGGVNQVDSFLQGATSVRVSSTETRAITSCVRVAPALKLSSKKYPDFLPTKLAPVLRHLYRKMGGSWEKWRVATGWPGLPKSRFPHRYGVKREDPRGKWMLEAIKVGLRVSTLPWPHLMDNFDHYARITNNLKAQPSGSAPRTLWALDKDDFELDMTTVTQCALHWSGDDGSGSLMKIDFHNPFWGNNMPQVISAFHNFMDKKEHEQIMPLTYQNAARLGLI